MLSARGSIVAKHFLADDGVDLHVLLFGRPLLFDEVGFLRFVAHELDMSKPRSSDKRLISVVTGRAPNRKAVRLNLAQCADTPPQQPSHQVEREQERQPASDVPLD